MPGKAIDLYTISNIKGASRTQGAIKAMVLKNFDVTGKMADIGKFAKNSKGNFRGVSLGNSGKVSKIMASSDALGAIGIGFTWAGEAVTTGDEYGKTLSSNDDGLTKASKISASTAGMSMRTITKLGTGTIKGANWIISKTRYINLGYYMQGKEQFERGLKMSNDFMDKMDKTADRIYSGENIYNTINNGMR